MGINEVQVGHQDIKRDQHQDIRKELGQQGGHHKELLAFQGKTAQRVGAKAAKENGQYHNTGSDDERIDQVSDKIADLKGGNVILEGKFRPGRK